MQGGGDSGGGPLENEETIAVVEGATDLEGGRIGCLSPAIPKLEEDEEEVYSGRAITIRGDNTYAQHRIGGLQTPIHGLKLREWVTGVFNVQR